MKLRSVRRARNAFSLMEMILATAILAGSGAALFALIGNGSLFGQRGEERAEALQLAENILAEVAAGSEINQQSAAGTGVNRLDSRWVYEVSLLENSRFDSLNLVCLAVQVAPSSDPDNPVCRLVRWVRTAKSASISEASDRDADGFGTDVSRAGGNSS